MLGFRRQHTAVAVAKSDRLVRQGRLEDIRCALLGNSFSCPVVALLLGAALCRCGVLPGPVAIEHLVNAVSVEDQTIAEARLAARGTTEEEELVAQFHRAAIFKGSDVRIDTGALADPRGWPRQPIEAGLWSWRICFGYRKSGAHINVLELYAVLMALRWRFAHPQAGGRRALHLLDSQVGLAVLAKGRSSSKMLMRVLRRVNALVLAAQTVMLYGYLRTGDNPADTPSRWGQK